MESAVPLIRLVERAGVVLRLSHWILVYDFPVLTDRGTVSMDRIYEPLILMEGNESV